MFLFFSSNFLLKRLFYSTNKIFHREWIYTNCYWTTPYCLRFKMSHVSLYVHKYSIRYLLRIRFIVMIGGASLFDLHISVQTCKESWDRYSWRTILETRPRDLQPEWCLRRDSSRTHPSRFEPYLSTTGLWPSPKQNNYGRLPHQRLSHFLVNPYQPTNNMHKNIPTE